MTIRELADAIITACSFEQGQSKVYRHYNGRLQTLAWVNVGENEPQGVMPLNVLWLVMDNTSPFYKKFLRRTSKTSVPPFANTWELDTSINLLQTAQTYDPADIAASQVQVGLATDTEYGVAQLNVAADQVQAPVFCGSLDPRLTDDRYPIDHTHPEKPMQLIVPLVQVGPRLSPAVVGATLVATSSTECEQKKLGLAAVQME